MGDRGGKGRWPDAILIAGPTASGKSALAIELAQRFGGLVINADSMQVYRDLQIITARPTPIDVASVPHALYGTIDGAQNHSVRRWLTDAVAAIEHAATEGLLPIVVGGTGLYFKALTQGLSDIPVVPDSIRAAMRSWAEGREPRALYDTLVRRDPKTAARLRPTDPQRILRALEVNEATGQALADFQDNRRRADLDIDRCVAAALVPDRAALARRIEARFDRMIDAGAVSEVETLASRGLDPALPVMRAHGVPPLLAYLDGACDLETAIVEGKAATRRYVKRQGTFTRNQLPAFVATPPEMASGLLSERIDQFV